MKYTNIFSLLISWANTELNVSSKIDMYNISGVPSISMPDPMWILGISSWAVCGPSSFN